MTDTDKLKRLAEEVLSNSLPVCAEYTLAQGILALIAENEGIQMERAEFKEWFRRASEEINEVTDQLDEAVALLREIVRTGVEESCEHGDQRRAMRLISDFLARIDTEESQ